MQDFGGFRVFLPGVSQTMMLIRGLQDPEVYALGSLWFLVLRRLYDWGGLGPKTAQKWFNDPEKPRAPKRLRNGPGRAQKSSEMVRVEVQKGSEIVREKPPKRLRNGPGRAQKKGRRNGPGLAQKRPRNGPEEPKKAQKRSERTKSLRAQKWSGRSPKRLKNGPGLRNGPGSPKGSEMVGKSQGSEMVRRSPERLRTLRGGRTSAGSLKT